MVRELGTAISQVDPIYSWTKAMSLSEPVLGVSNISFRQDCAGFVSACIGVFRAIQKGGAYHTCNMNSSAFESSVGLEDMVGFFESGCGSGQDGCESMIFAGPKHTEASDETGKVWSGGGHGERTAYWY